MKKLLMIPPLALILCFMVGCQDKEAMAELEEFRAQAEVEEQNKEIVVKMYKEMDKQNFDIAIEFCAPDALIYFAGSSEPMKPKDMKPIFPMWYTAFPDYAHTIDEVVAKGDVVVVRLASTGTHEAEFMGAPATGNTFKCSQIHMWRIKESKIVEGWLMDDMLGLMQQLGMELKPKEKE